MRRARAGLWLSSLLLPWLAGCLWSAPPPHIVLRHRDLSLDHETLRVLLHPLQLDAGLGYPDEAASVSRALALELDKTGVLDLERLDPTREDWGVSSPGGALEPALTYDAVLRGRILRLHPYPPMALALHVALESTKTGRILWEVQAVFDASEAGTIADLRSYSRTILAPEHVSYGFEGALLSFERFTQYACQRIVATLTRSVGRE